MHDPAATYYRGARAHGYEATRAQTEQWKREQAAMAAILDKVRPRSVLDVPIGTGRFLSYYAEREIAVVGVDISTDMISEARRRADELGVPAELAVGDITALDLADDAVELAVCIRLMNLVDFETLRRGLSELGRVSKDGRVIVGLRLVRPIHLRGEGIADHAQHLARAAFRRIAGRRPFGRNNPHPHAATLEEIAAQGFTVEEQRLIEWRPDGSGYYFFLLHR